MKIKDINLNLISKSCYYYKLFLCLENNSSCYPKTDDRNALANVDAFQSTYGSLLHGVKTRQPLTTHKDALPLLIHKKSIKATLGVLHQLQQEKTLAAGFSNTIFADKMVLIYVFVYSKVFT
ncbi:MAG: hypothetical protein OMM_12354 [Candidatus Magnetoglobus multicellularis str. Araruama]|uniref:Uncharacterized protein n=1 Tax=Candidatus Magnetoglobus multicellularis str. Araruama TaxID=890399 RepID=A0A1V1NW05_9BACT|nr:MAG: hypothetical protein OMM_12354 [Candidatus Magnetoglobus multicellularis str. Araruama]